MGGRARQHLSGRDVEEHARTLEVTIQAAVASPLLLVPGEAELVSPPHVSPPWYLRLLNAALQSHDILLLTFLNCALPFNPLSSRKPSSGISVQLTLLFWELLSQLSCLILTVGIFFMLSFKYFLLFLCHLGWSWILQLGC